MKRVDDGAVIPGKKGFGDVQVPCAGRAGHRQMLNQKKKNWVKAPTEKPEGKQKKQKILDKKKGGERTPYLPEGLSAGGTN